MKESRLAVDGRDGLKPQEPSASGGGSEYMMLPPVFRQQTVPSLPFPTLGKEEGRYRVITSSNQDKMGNCAAGQAAETHARAHTKTSPIPVRAERRGQPQPLSRLRPSLPVLCSTGDGCHDGVVAPGSTVPASIPCF